MQVSWRLEKKCKDNDIKKIDFRVLIYIMITLKTSDLFIENIDKKLSDIVYIQNIADDYSKNHKLYAFYTIPFKIELCFENQTSLKYVMVEKNIPKEVNYFSQCLFIDDLSIFDKTLSEVETLWETSLNNNSVKIGKISLFFEKEKVDSLYYFP